MCCGNRCPRMCQAPHTTSTQRGSPCGVTLPVRHSPHNQLAAGGRESFKHSIWNERRHGPVAREGCWALDVARRRHCWQHCWRTLFGRTMFARTVAQQQVAWALTHPTNVIVLMQDHAHGSRSRHTRDTGHVSTLSGDVGRCRGATNARPTPRGARARRRPPPLRVARPCSHA